MLKKIKFKAINGWVLTELLCCMAIVTSLMVCVTQSVDGITRVGRAMHAIRTKVEDYSSLSNEINSCATASGELERGSWRAEVTGSGCTPSLHIANVVMETVTSGSPRSIGWKSWYIPGRQ